MNEHSAIRCGTLDDPRHIAVIHAMASENIVGYHAHGAMAADEYRKGKLAALFLGHGVCPPSASVFVALDGGASIAGALVLETSWDQRVADEDPDRAREFARYHRTLAGLFVLRKYRRRGVARHLVWEAAAPEAMRQGARYIDGFVDDRAGSVDFYRDSHATVMGRNEGLPARQPALIRGLHRTKDNGHWFYFDLWPTFAPRMRCSRCYDSLRFDPADGGWMVCDSCAPPSAADT